MDYYQELKKKAEAPERSEWRCHMFGSDPKLGNGFIYTPAKGQHPNRFVRWMMKICLGCTWVKSV